MCTLQFSCLNDYTKILFFEGELQRYTIVGFTGFLSAIVLSNVSVIWSAAVTPNFVISKLKWLP